MSDNSAGLTRRHGGRNHGQAAVELALVLPLLCLLLLGAVQIVLVVSDQVVAIQAARVGARAAAVSADPTTASEAAVRHAIGQAGRVVTTTDDGFVTVTVAITNQTNVAFIGSLMPDVVVSGRATMILEPP